MEFKGLIGHIVSTHNTFSNKASSSINQFLTLRNWIIGYYIVEYEQNGSNKAKYGEQLINLLAEKLKSVKGIDRRSLFRFRQFYIISRY